MIKEFGSQIRTAAILLILLTILTGFIYPILVTGFAQLLFPWQANGSLITQNEINIGSLHIGQYFTSPGYFWGRPSATSPFPYNGEASSGSNKGPSNPDFLETVKERVIQIKQSIDSPNQFVPVDLVTSSGSGLDPDISPLAAFYQAPRIAKERDISEEIIKELIKAQIQNRSYFLLGEPRINVLKLNMALDNLRITNGQSTPKS